MRSAAKQLEFERAAALRDEIQDIRRRVLEEDASVAVLQARPSGRPPGHADARRATASARPSERAARPQGRAAAGAPPRWRASRRWRSPRSRSCRPARSRWTSTKAPPRTSSRASRTRTRTSTRAGWRAGSTDPPGTAASRPTSSSGPARGPASPLKQPRGAGVTLTGPDDRSIAHPQRLRVQGAAAACLSGPDGDDRLIAHLARFASATPAARTPYPPGMIDGSPIWPPATARRPPPAPYPPGMIDGSAPSGRQRRRDRGGTTTSMMWHPYRPRRTPRGGRSRMRAPCPSTSHHKRPGPGHGAVPVMAATRST